VPSVGLLVMGSLLRDCVPTSAALRPVRRIGGMNERSSWSGPFWPSRCENRSALRSGMPGPRPGMTKRVLAPASAASEGDPSFRAFMRSGE
jgi:hypothetical protein